MRLHLPYQTSMTLSQDKGAHFLAVNCGRDWSSQLAWYAAMTTSRLHVKTTTARHPGPNAFVKHARNRTCRIPLFLIVGISQFPLAFPRRKSGCLSRLGLLTWPRSVIQPRLRITIVLAGGQRTLTQFRTVQPRQDQMQKSPR